MLHVALYQPSIPPNTGNIGRTCVGMGAGLHLIGPVAFDLSDHAVKRAGLDYWEHLKLTVHPTPDAFVDWLGGREPWLVTKFGDVRFDQAAYGGDDVLIFGNENTGIPQAWHERWAGRRVSIPIPGKVRSYNVANTVAIVLAQAMVKAGDREAGYETGARDGRGAGEVKAV